MSTHQPFGAKRIALGVSGSIAAYKALELASTLTKAGALVDVLLSPSAQRFVTPLAFRSLTHRPVLTGVFDPDTPEAIEHVALAQAAEALVVAPATAHMLAKLAHGLADDPVSLLALATAAPVLVAPAMDAHMWEHPAVQANARTLTERGALVVGPAEGRLASGLTGRGRLEEPAVILGHLAGLLGRNGDMAGLTVVVSAGGTAEPVDPVRVLTNRSSGKMGYALAEVARDRGARVVLVSAPTALPALAGVELVPAATAAAMRDAVLAACKDADALVMAAAVADYRPTDPAGQKVKKERSSSLSLALERTEDILAATPRSLVRVGFAAESEDLAAHARSKLVSKALDLVVANDITEAGSGFGADENHVLLVGPQGDEQLDRMPKYQVAWAIWDRVAALLAKRG
ncbi:MAG: bifunctional phosphopantothenoylcysteine decarboxylase/phosphopantothenate--cysteine ligase CoaBC [Chloroflexota bacterium]